MNIENPPDCSKVPYPQSESDMPKKFPYPESASGMQKRFPYPQSVPDMQKYVYRQ